MSLTQANFQVIIRVRPLNTKQQQQIQSYESAHSKKFKSSNSTNKTIKLSPTAYAFYTKFYNIQSLNDIMKVQNTNTISVIDTEYKNTQKKLKPFVFSHVYGQRETSTQIFEQSILDQMQCIFDGFNYTILAYGITGSGKTHTVFGSYEKNQSGICSLAMNYLLSKKQQLQQSHNAKVLLKFSFIEIYNQTIRDLLNPDTKMLNIIEDQKGNTTFVDATEIYINTEQEINEMIAIGLQKRSSSATLGNQYSSRSHAIMQMGVEVIKQNGQKITSKMFIVDLAGSEKIQTLNTAKKMLEGANINKSLLALGNCINILAQNSRKGLNGSTMHIPYRDSKLTRILKDSLGGNSKTLMIACVSENPFTIEETITTLNYAQRAQVIKKQVKRNKEDDDKRKSLCTKCMGQLDQSNDRRACNITLPRSLMSPVNTQKDSMLATFFQQIYDDILQNIRQKVSIERILQSRSISSSQIDRLKQVNENQRLQLKQTMWKLFIQKEQLYDQKLTELNQFVEAVNGNNVQNSTDDEDKSRKRTQSKSRRESFVNNEKMDRTNSQLGKNINNRSESSRVKSNSKPKRLGSAEKASTLTSISRRPLQSRINTYNQQEENYSTTPPANQDSVKYLISPNPPHDENSHVRFSFASLLTSETVSKVQSLQNCPEPDDKEKPLESQPKRKKSRSKFQVVKRMSTSKLSSKQLPIVEQ